MASSQKNLSVHSQKGMASVINRKFSIIISEWNEEITEALYSGAYQTLIGHGVSPANIERTDVPGSFELPLGAQIAAKSKAIDAVICIGCVIKGETPHFNFICNAVSQGIKDVMLKYEKPVVFGVLTTETLAQAMDRAGGKHGNKGDEAAITAIKMLGILP